MTAVTEARVIIAGFFAAYEQGTDHQFLVYVGTTTGDAPIEDWAVGRAGVRLLESRSPLPRTQSDLL